MKFIPQPSQGRCARLTEKGERVEEKLFNQSSTAQRFTRACRQADIPRDEVARRAGVSAMDIARLESGEYSLDSSDWDDLFRSVFGSRD